MQLAPSLHVDTFTRDNLPRSISCRRSTLGSRNCATPNGTCCAAELAGLHGLQPTGPTPCRRARVCLGPTCPHP